ncbi:phage antirepressor KilAC domain-containing protein [Pseudomonas aeruginosa]|uniref:phage antirepressor KilAC domain-containing protein n=1 Tax=Pseudomonas aeruginosa TaxID=287 RepID=UPI00383BD778
MKDSSLHQAAQRLGLTRPALIARMKEAGLLDENNRPAHPQRDRQFIRVRETSWQHPDLGTQFGYSTKVRPGGLAWLAEQLGIPRVGEQPPPQNQGSE